MQPASAQPSDILRIVPAGDEALVVDFPAVISRDVNGQVRKLFHALRTGNAPAIKGLVPSYRSLLVYYDPSLTAFAALADLVRTVSETAENAAEPTRRWTLPVCYGMGCEADLDDLAGRLGLSTETIIATHSATTYMVYMIGFSPGFAYLGELPPQLEIPRKTVPAPLVPANTVQIGGRQTAVSSMPMPSGWYVVGRTPVPMFAAARKAPFLLDGGDLVSFERVSTAEFARIASRVEQNSYVPPSEYVA